MCLQWSRRRHRRRRRSAAAVDRGWRAIPVPPKLTEFAREKRVASGSWDLCPYGCSRKRRPCLWEEKVWGDSNGDKSKENFIFSIEIYFKINIRKTVLPSIWWEKNMGFLDDRQSVDHLLGRGRETFPSILQSSSSSSSSSSNSLQLGLQPGDVLLGRHHISEGIFQRRKRSENILSRLRVCCAMQRWWRGADDGRSSWKIVVVRLQPRYEIYGGYLSRRRRHGGIGKTSTITSVGNSHCRVGKVIVKTGNALRTGIDMTGVTPGIHVDNAGGDVDDYHALAGCWVGSRPKRFLTVYRWRENLSSGEKRAGWAEVVGLPLGSTFSNVYTRSPFSFM